MVREEREGREKGEKISKSLKSSDSGGEIIRHPDLTDLTDFYKPLITRINSKTIINRIKKIKTFTIKEDCRNNHERNNI